MIAADALYGNVEDDGGSIWSEFPVLDHGHVRLLDTMGSDREIVQAARLSYDSERPASEDRALIRYLMRSGHTSPFEMAEIKIEAKMPIFVARQWVRHRTASINEVSSRYTELPGEFYIPDAADLQPQSASNKQGREGSLSEQQASDFQHRIRRSAQVADADYRALLGAPMDQGDNGAPGIARELARMVLPLNTYTRWVWKIDVNNLLKFLALRLDAHAQKEIRVYAEAIAKIVKWWLPLTWEAFEDYHLNAMKFSAQELICLKAIMVNGGIVENIHRILSDREVKELTAKINRMSALDTSILDEPDQHGEPQ